MIKIKKHDTLIGIVEKIQRSPQEEIVLKFPLGHPILHNYLSLKIIKSKSSPKKITIVTQDIVSRKIGKKLGIHYQITKEWLFARSQEEESNIMKHNFSLSEYFVFEIKKYYHEILWFVRNNNDINKIRSYSRSKTSYAWLGLFISLLCISIALFIFIFYFAISKTTITITPEIYVKKRSQNFTFSENTFFDVFWNDKNIEIKPLQNKITLTETYSTTWIEESWLKKSQWNVTLYNNSSSEIQLLPQTRIQNEEGIIFEITTWSKIPPAVVDNFWESIPGSVDAKVIAQNYTLDGDFTGSKGNVEKDVLFILPWLEDNGEIVYAKSISKFTWGKDSYTLQASSEDIENAKTFFEQKLKNEVVKSLKKKVLDTNTIDNSNIDLLTIDNLITYSDIDIRILNNVEAWTITENFILEWSIIWKSYTYDKKSLINKMNSVIQEWILDGVESILLIDESSLRFSTEIYRKTSPLEVKVTVEIDTLISHDFGNINNAYTNKLKGRIRWISKEEAIKLLLNEEKISNVSVSIRPFFISNVSNISENIIFEVKKD